MNINDKNLLKKVFIVCLILLCFYSIQTDGIKLFTVTYSPSKDDARKLFFKGRYIDASSCFSRCGSLFGRDAELKEISIFMSSYFYGYNNEFRIFFKLPNIFPYNGKDGSTPGDVLPDDIKSEIYETVSRYDYVDSKKVSYENDNDLRKALCYKFCRKYKDSKERYEKYIKGFAEDYINKKEYRKAEDIITELSKKEDIEQLKLKIYEACYNEALLLRKKGLFISSKNFFEYLNLKNYKDSKQQFELNKDILMHKLGMNIEALGNKKFYSKNRLYANLRSANNYLKDKYSVSKTEIIKKCKDYLKALGEKSYEQKDYYSAYYYLSSALIAEKQDSRILESARNFQKSSIESGDVVLFGHYEQDGNIDNGAEPIEWIVLGVKKHKALLLSKYILGNKEMHLDPQKTRWEESSLRKWLNEDFFKEVFSNSEKQRMLKIELSLKTLDNVTIYLNEDSFPFRYHPEIISDYVVCPDINDMFLLIKNFDISAYAVPALEIFLSKNEKQFLNPSLFGIFDSEKNNSESDEDDNKVYVPYGYWLRSDSVSSKNSINSYGFEDDFDVYKKNGIRPVVLLKLDE